MIYSKEYLGVVDIHEIETWGCLPHLEKGGIDETKFPSIKAPMAEADQDLMNENDDLIWKRGVAIGEEIMRMAAKSGRRRRPEEDNN